MLKKKNRNPKNLAPLCTGPLGKLENDVILHRAVIDLACEIPRKDKRRRSFQHNKSGFRVNQVHVAMPGTCMPHSHHLSLSLSSGALLNVWLSAAGRNDPS